VQWFVINQQRGVKMRSEEPVKIIEILRLTEMGLSKLDIAKGTDKNSTILEKKKSFKSVDFGLIMHRLKL
jgi:hypothetical protein